MSAASSCPSSSRASPTRSWCVRSWAACVKWWRATSSGSQVGRLRPLSLARRRRRPAYAVSVLLRLPRRPAAAGHRPAERPAGRPLHQTRLRGLRPAAQHCPGHPGPQGRGETRSTFCFCSSRRGSELRLFQGPTRTHVQLIMERLLRRVNRSVIAMDSSSPLIVRTLSSGQLSRRRS